MIYPDFVPFLFIGSAVVALAGAWLAARSARLPKWWYLALAMVAVTIWCFGDGMLFLADDIEVRRFWLTFAFLGRMAGVPLIFSFALSFAQLNHWLSHPRQWALWTPFLLAMGLAVTNPWHGLIWEIGIDPLDLTGAPGHGFYFYLMMPVIYGVLTATIVIFLQSVWRLRHVYRQQAIVLTIAVLLPVMANVLYFTDFNPLPSVDLASAAFAVTGILLIYSMKRLHLMDLRPIYRDALFDLMVDGVLVISHEGRIVDLNRAARASLPQHPDPVGLCAANILSGFFHEDIGPVLQAGFHETLETREETVRYLDVRVVPLADSPEEPDALLLVWRNVSALRKAVATIYEQERVLAIVGERERADSELTARIEQVLQAVEVEARAALENLDAGRPGVAATYIAQTASVAATAQKTAAEQLHHAEPSLEEFTAAVRRYVTNFAAAHDLQAVITLSVADVETVLTAEQRLQAVRIMQEALDNVQRHARAQTVCVTMTATDASVVMTITDDGVGFDPQLAAAHSAGIESLYHRARAVNAELTLISAPGSGASVRVEFPVRIRLVNVGLTGTRIAVADHHPLMLDGLRKLLSAEGAEVVAAVTSASDLVAAVGEQQPELVLLDLAMPDGASITALQEIKQRNPDTAVVLLLTSDHDPMLAAALHAGADGYLLKSLDADQFFATLAKVAARELSLAPGLASMVLAEFRGYTPLDAPELAMLSDRQKEILRLVASSKTYSEIAARLYLSERTVRYHMDQIRARLGLANRNEVLAFAQTHGLTTDRSTAHS